MHTPALTSQQMRYLLAEARDGTPFPALESMKEHLLAQAEPEKAQVTETGIKSESRDMASGKEALAEQAGLDGTQKINQNMKRDFRKTPSSIPTTTCVTRSYRKGSTRPP